MPVPRKLLVDPSKTVYYHVTSRCVRRAYLCGVDHSTGVNYEHRKHWIEQRIRLLSSIFSIDVCSYAVMSNHYHIVLKLNPCEPKNWSEGETIDRWRCLYKGPLLIQRASRGEALSFIEQCFVSATVATYKDRLGSLSWFMRALNEPLAKMANAEDDCTGHFWESRFSSQALFTTAALLACMVYVDLNPVRAKISKTPDRSEFTSYKERVHAQFNLRQALAEQFESDALRAFHVGLKPLLQFADSSEEDSQKTDNCLPITFDQYAGLLNFSAEARNKTSRERSEEPGMLRQLGLTTKQWLIDANHFEALYRLGAFRSPIEMALGLNPRNESFSTI